MERFCRICYEGGDNLVQPCKCKGTMADAHKACLHEFYMYKTNTQCPVCHASIRLCEMPPQLGLLIRSSVGGVVPRLEFPLCGFEVIRGNFWVTDEGFDLYHLSDGKHCFDMVIAPTGTLQSIWISNVVDGKICLCHPCRKGGIDPVIAIASIGMGLFLSYCLA